MNIKRRCRFKYNRIQLNVFIFARSFSKCNVWREPDREAFYTHERVMCVCVWKWFQQSETRLTRSHCIWSILHTKNPLCKNNEWHACMRERRRRHKQSGCCNFSLSIWWKLYMTNWVFNQSAYKMMVKLCDNCWLFCLEGGQCDRPFSNSQSMEISAVRCKTWIQFKWFWKTTENERNSFGHCACMCVCWCASAQMTR